MSWRARPVFVSGTFRDMHAERDLLADRAFRDLEETLAEHYTFLERVDLRVGVETRGLADDHAKQELVLKVCLADVKRCRPFLIVLIGDRYGWVPPIDRARAAAGEAGFHTTLEGKSVTALEIEFGLWGDPDQQTRSRIYFRNLDYTGMDEADAIVYSDARAAASTLVSTGERARAAQRAAALVASKRRLRGDSVLGPRCRDYAARWDPIAKKVIGLGAFIAHVVTDLLPEMIAEADEQVVAAKAGKLPTALEQFVAERSRGFRGRADIVGRLCAHATDPGDADKRGLVVAGVSGGGKSAIFARVYEELAGSAMDDFWLLAHAAGIDPRSTSFVSLLEDWIAVLAAKLGVENPLAAPADGPDTRDRAITGTDKRPKPDEAFADLLTRAAAKQRVVLLLDALDRFERTPQAEHLTWLPAPLPGNVRLIATAVTGPETEALARRPDVVVEPLVPLTADEARKIAQTVYDRYHRQSNPDAVRELVEKRGPDEAPAHGNALWLVSALEELNLLDGDDFRRAEVGTEGTDEDRLHAMVVGEARVLPGDVEALYARIFERAGRRVSDDPREGPALTRAFVAAIALSRGGFRERDLAALIPGVARLLDPSAPSLAWDALGFASLRRALRAHLVRRGEDDRWDFHHRQARSAAERAYVSDAGMRKRIHDLVADHLLGLPPDDPLREGETMYHLLRSGDRGRAACHYASNLSEGALISATRALAAQVVEDDGAAVAASLLAVDALSVVERWLLCNRLLRNVTDVLEAVAPLVLRLQVLRTVEEHLSQMATVDSGNLRWQLGLVVSHEKVGDVLVAQGDLIGALDAFRESQSISRRLAAAVPGNAWLESYLSVGHHKVGNVLVAQGNLPGALDAFQESLRIFERLTAAEPGNAGWQRDLSVGHEKVGDVLVAQGSLPVALTAYQASLAIAERLAGAEPWNAERQRDLSLSRIKVGDMLAAQENLAGARATYQESLAIAERLAAADPWNAGRQRDLANIQTRIAHVLVSEGNVSGALRACRESLAICQRLAAVDPGNAGWQRDLSVAYERFGDVLMAQEDLSGALGAFMENRAIRARLAVTDPGNAGWQRDLAISLQRMGEIKYRQGDMASAEQAFRESLCLFKTVSAENPTNATLLVDMAQAHELLAKSLDETSVESGGERRALLEHGMDIKRRFEAQVSLNQGQIAQLAALEQAFHKLGVSERPKDG